MTRVPAEVFPLAYFIADELTARRWTTTDLARRMGGKNALAVWIDLLCVDLLLCVQDDNLLVGDRVFEGLANAFGVSEQFLRALDDAWRNHQDQRVKFEPPETLFGPTSRRRLLHVVRPK